METILFSLQNMQWYWLSLTAIFTILEVTFGANFFLLWLGLISFMVGMLTWAFPFITWEYQLFIFAVGSIVSILFWQQYIKSHPIQSDRPTLNRRNEQYIGRTFVLLDDMENGRGKIRVDDTTWQVEGPDLPAGTKVKVIAANGVILKVERCS